MTLILTRCPRTHRPHPVPVKMLPAIAKDPIHPVHRRPLPREIRPPSLKNVAARLKTLANFVILPPTVVLLVLHTRAPRQLHRRGTMIGPKIGANSE